MAKYAIIVMSEHSEGNPGGQARLLHALSAAKDFADAGEEVGIWFHGVGVTWLAALNAQYDQFMLVGGMGARLVGGDEPGSHPGAGRTQVKHRGESAAVADPARRQHRQVNLAEHRLKQGQQPTVAPDMPARFHALHGHDIAAGVGRGLGLIERTDLPAGQRALAMRQLDQPR